MRGAQAVQLAIRSHRQNIRRIVTALARHLDGQILDVIRLRIVAADRRPAADGVDGPVAVHRHVAAGRAEVAAFAYFAGGNIVDEEDVLRLAAIIQLAARIVDRAGDGAFLLLEDADAAAETGLGIVIAKVSAGIAVGVLAILRPRAENLMGLLAGEPDATIGADDDLGVDLALRVDAATPLAGEL